jgi:hypothetical protein
LTPERRASGPPDAAPEPVLRSRPAQASARVPEPLRVPGVGQEPAREPDAARAPERESGAAQVPERVSGAAQARQQAPVPV